MEKEITVTVSPEVAGDDKQLLNAAVRQSGISADEVHSWRILRKSIDARKAPVKYNIRLLLFTGTDSDRYRLPDFSFPNVKNRPSVVIVGAGPAGLFAALTLLKNNLKPIVLERGKDVRGRRRDIAALMKDHLVNPDSNYCFGEGGAGTYSDGKLYTRSTKRGNVQHVLETLVYHGAPQQILWDAHPHIGTNKLPGVIQSIRQTILDHGGEVHFNERVTDIATAGGRVSGVTTATGLSIEASHVILATGHSARDIFNLVYEKGWAMEAKPFALGVRVEHPQKLIDHIQYHCDLRGPYLPPASYSVVKQAGGRGVYSFCMCPGGIIAPCATAPGEVVTNGWSPSKRDQPTANSGIVVELRPDDFKEFAKEGSLSAMFFQSSVEKKCWDAAGRTQRVPAQRLSDFLKGKISADLPETSYQPGITSMDLREVLPPQVYDALKEGFGLFGRAMHGFVTEEAIIHAPESRTSSPVRIPRDMETLEHPEVGGLYPCGEGAGYAGGIVSAAMDGIRCAERCVFSR
ncbi:MAG: FAD-dependent oxidoreductase [Flavobacteriales bacterium]|nr:FAD-dependent oxidoreductase [Flavobacteriales bacterium]